MVTNIEFDDNIVGVINRAASETALFTSSLADLNSELSSLVECMGNLVNSLDEGLNAAFTTASSEGLNLSNILNSLSGTIELAANAVAIFAAKKEIIAALSAAFLALKLDIAAMVLTVTICTSNATLAAGALAVLKVALIALGDVIKAHPVMFLAGVLIAASPAIIAFFDHINKGSENFQAFNARMEEAKKKTDELNASMKESETAYKGSTEKIEAQAGAAEKLAEKVFALAEADNKSAEEKRQLAVLVDELNSAMPGLNLVYDEQAWEGVLAA